MLKRTSSTLGLLIWLCGCAGSDGEPADDGDSIVEESTSEPGETANASADESRESEANDPTRSDGGGTSGSEGSTMACEETATEVALDEVPPGLDFSAEELLATVGGAHEISVYFHPLDAGPEWPAGEGSVIVNVEANADTARGLRCDDPDYPEKYRKEPRLEVNVIIELRSADGRLDERFETTLSAESVARAAPLSTLVVAPQDAGGTVGSLVADYYEGSNDELLIDLVLREEGPTGLLMGPFSPHRSAPCREATYAVWPAESDCLPEQDPSRLEDDTLDSTLEQLNRTVVLSFADGTEAEADVEVTPQGPNACRNWGGGVLFTRVDVRLRSDAAEVDLLAGGWLSTSTYDDTGLHRIRLEAAAALDRDALSEQLRSYEGDAQAAIASIAISINPPVVPVVELEGRFGLREIDREGFATELPELTEPVPGVGVPLGWNDTDHCFDSSPARRAPAVDAELGLP